VTVPDRLRPDRCEACRFWEPPSGYSGDYGECHHAAPAPRLGFRDTDDDGNGNYIDFVNWPLVLPDEWCGEWQPLPAKQKTEEGG
jgi:hypothetical protein